MKHTAWMMKKLLIPPGRMRVQSKAGDGRSRKEMEKMGVVILFLFVLLVICVRDREELFHDLCRTFRNRQGRVERAEVVYDSTGKLSA